MPTYQYRCTQCGEDLEAVQKFSDAPLTVCPTCGGDLRKVFNAVGVVFKGSGFYRTDSRNGSKSRDGADSGSSEKKSGLSQLTKSQPEQGQRRRAARAMGNNRLPADHLPQARRLRPASSVDKAHDPRTRP
jgi:putative FmdB family regulatory protein